MLTENLDNIKPEKRKVLIVDDHEDTRLLLNIVLSEQGWEVIEASDGFKALLLIEQNPPDLLILDNQMPRLSGIEVYKLLSTKKIKIPVVLISAYSDIEEVALSVGINYFLAKGFDLSDFLQIVELAYQS